MVLGFLKGFNVDGKRKQTNFEEKILKGIKLHTIRLDEKDRWFKGRKIHFATGTRSSKYNCFKESVCTGTQYIEINVYGYHTIYINGVPLDSIEIQDLAINDGFDSVYDFWQWFDQYRDIQGKIIHWSNLRY